MNALGLLRLVSSTSNQHALSSCLSNALTKHPNGIVRFYQEEGKQWCVISVMLVCWSLGVQKLSKAVDIV